MAKKVSEKKHNTFATLLNKISGGVVIALGSLLLIFSFSGFNTELGLFYPVINLLSSVALIFLGVYILRFEKWAVVLAGVYGLVMILNNIWILGLFSGNFLGIIVDISYFVLIINWAVFSNVK